MSPRVLAAACLLASAAVLGQTAEPPRAFSIVGATIHPVSGPDIVGGTIVVGATQFNSGTGQTDVVGYTLTGTAQKVSGNTYELVVQDGQGNDQTYHLEWSGSGDLVITNDIPLAANVIPNGAAVINTRGEILDKENIRERLRVRNLMEEIRNSGHITGGPAPLDNADKAKFSNALDRWLARNPLK